LIQFRYVVSDTVMILNMQNRQEPAGFMNIAVKETTIVSNMPMHLVLIYSGV
jgi:hypothetical protein